MNHFNFTRRTFLKSALYLSGAAAMSPFGPSPAFAAADSVIGRAELRIAHPRQFRILQFTDLHLFAGMESTHAPRNNKTIEIMRSLVAQTKPGLLMVTGDLWPENRDGMGEKYMHYAVEQLASLGVPWAYTWGNHDQLPDFSAGHAAFAKAQNSLYRGADSDGNYVIDIKDDAGRRVWQILCLNTHRAGMQAPERAWLNALRQSEPQSPQRFAYFHIPLKQYDTIWENGTAAGIKGESVCLEEEDGSTLALLKSMEVKACFCGHDHVNDYAGLIDGVELVYGRATGVGGYGANIVPKGGKLVTLNCPKGTYEWVSITPDAKKWRPKTRERVDKSKKK